MFGFATPHQVRRSDGRPVAITIPVAFPPRILSDDLVYRFERQGYRQDGTPAGYYRADDGSDVWVCDGHVYSCLTRGE